MIRRCTIAEIESAPNVAEVLAEYAAESSLPELGPANARFDIYKTLEATGLFHPIGSFDGDRLTGFILPIVIVLPHYGVVAATVESFFVPAVERKNGTGLRLLAHAKTLAKDLGAKALLVSAPVSGVLAQMLARNRRFRHCNDVFVAAL